MLRTRVGGYGLLQAAVKQPIFHNNPCQVRHLSASLPASRSTPPEDSSQNKDQNAGTPAPSGVPERPATPYTTSVSDAAAEANTQPLPYLSHPLGVPTPPTAERRSWGDRHAEWFDRDVRLAKRRLIVKEATRGYFHDFHEIRSHGGKTWRSPNTMIRADKAMYFPNMEGVCLADRSKKHTAHLLQGKVSIVAIVTSKVSETPSSSLSRYAVSLTQINLQENALKAYLISLFVSSLRSQVDQDLQSTYLLCQQNMDMLRDCMGLHNKHVGYTYLVNADGKIRWAGSAFAERDEALALAACTGVLLNRLPQK